LLSLCKERNLRTLQSWHKSINISFSENHFQEITQALQELLAGSKSLPKKVIAEELKSLGCFLDDRLLTSLLVRSEIEGSPVFRSDARQGGHLGFAVGKSIYSMFSYY